MNSLQNNTGWEVVLEGRAVSCIHKREWTGCGRGSSRRRTRAPRGCKDMGICVDGSACEWLPRVIGDIIAQVRTESAILHTPCHPVDHSTHVTHSSHLTTRPCQAFPYPAGDLFKNGIGRWSPGPGLGTGPPFLSLSWDGALRSGGEELPLLPLGTQADRPTNCRCACRDLCFFPTSGQRLCPYYIHPYGEDPRAGGQVGRWAGGQPASHYGCGGTGHPNYSVLCI